jgi:hypothetical protein
MAQHVWEVGAAVFAALLVGQGLFHLIKPSAAPEADGMNPRTVHVAGWLMLLVGVGIGLAAFLVDAEQPGAHSPDHWGGAVGVAALSVWVAVMLGSFVLQIRKVKAASKQPPRPGRRAA